MSACGSTRRRFGIRASVASFFSGILFRAGCRSRHGQGCVTLQLDPRGQESAFIFYICHCIVYTLMMALF